MSVDPREVARLHRLADQVPDSGELGQLQSLDEVIAYVVASAIQEGLDTLDVVELVLTAIDPPRASLRASARVLRRLGYGPVADLTQRLARAAPRPKRKRRKARRSAPSPRQ